VSREVVLTLSGDTDDLGPNARMNRGKKLRLVKEWREKAQLTATNARAWRKTVPFEGPVIISFIIRRGRALDDDNAKGSHALKAICDGLRDAGLIKGDTLAFMHRGTVDQTTGPQWRLFPEVEVKITRE
jgi:hypothetical protein